MADERIDRDQVRHVAALARIELTEAEREQLQSDLSRILEYVDKLNELDTVGVEPTFQVGEPGTLMREDAVTNEPAPDQMLANAPARDGAYFKVPKIIE